MRIRTISSRTSHVLTLDDGSEVELAHRPSEIHHYKDLLVERVGDKLVLGYLVHDDDCSHPLDDCYGMGRVVGRGKYQTRNHNEIDMFEALGLDRNGDTNLELVQDDVNDAFEEYLESVPEETWTAIGIALGLDSNDDGFTLIVETLIEMLKREDIFNSDVLWVMKGAAHYVDDLNPDHDQLAAAAELLDFDVDVLTQKLYEDKVRAGKIGNPDAVVLDVYDHSGIAWSISGGGTQCRWDTSSGAGVWLPDEGAKEEIDRRAPVYATHYVRETPLRLHGKDNKYQLIDATGEKEVSVAMGDDWGQLFRMAEEYAKAHGDLTPEELAEGRARAARELAGQALDVYNAWLGGDCYGIVCETFELANPGAEPEHYEWRQVDENDCWGYVGSDHAIESLHHDFFDGRVADLQAQALV